MTSLRSRLFILLLLGTGLVWLGAAAWIYAGATRHLDQVLDSRLRASAQMVTSLVAEGQLLTRRDADAAPAVLPRLGGAERALSCQIWSLDGRLVARSGGAPEARLSEDSGFSLRQVGGQAWRIYAMEDAASGLRVLVGDRLADRQQLVTALLKALLVPALLVLPVLGLLLWASLTRGLRPLRRLTRDLRQRGADDMHPLDSARAPQELRPMAAALNDLLAKVAQARRHEREVTAFAAHELRTPLAGLKTQAQIALAAPDGAARQAALQQILLGVDRTTRLVRQLLSLARLDAAGHPDPQAAQAPLDLGRLLEEVVAGTPCPEAVQVELSPALRGQALRADREMLALALRNLHENALQHMPPEGGLVRWDLAGDRLAVEDEGPGIPPEELALVTRRFYRGRNKSPTGSGLGLAIAELALRQCGAELHLRNRAGGKGLRAEITLAAA